LEQNYSKSQKNWLKGVPNLQNHANIQRLGPA